MIRLCHVQVFSIMSGVQRSMLESIRQIDRARFEPHVVCKEPGPMTEELAKLDVPVHLAPSLDRPLRPWRDYQAYCQLRRIFVDGHFDIVHTHSSKPGILGRLAARSAGVPYVVHQVHAFAFHEYSSRPRRWMYEQIERRAAPWCDRLLFVNREERDLVIDRGWLPARDCLTIYNGTDLDEVHPRHRAERATQRAQWRADDKEIVILFMGRLEYPKQPLLLAEIADRLQALRPERPWRLVVAGDGPEEPALAEAIRRHGLASRVQLLGWQSDPLGALHAADVVLLTSLAEGLPRSLIDAQAAGLPVVASDAKGNREVVTRGTGFLCPPKDPEGYAQALARLIDSAELRDALGVAARHHAEREFDTVVNQRRLVDVYESMLAA